MSMVPLLVESSALVGGGVTLLVLLIALGIVRGVGKGRPHS
ncbi:hypothetical protein O6R08_03815 [Cutibacterium equinum]|uniref:Uncharacterized protein n=1 Tax=Cutibacterium equinum TaxID=3016342 RepID=A0ABY7R1X5_9ACTN|nr:hypothetical protein [Cutibacterium equinum]WCC80628.1 hypothetical protein O6R08_03815 [Cutibacterium equinum]